jgi:hypothetical protein
VLGFAFVLGFHPYDAWLTSAASSFGFSSLIRVRLMDSIFVVWMSYISNTLIISSSSLLVLRALRTN